MMSVKQDKKLLAKLSANWNEAKSAYTPAFRRARVLDATDRGKLWKAIGAKFPRYQLLPDTNHTAKVKTSLLASLYSVGRCAEVMPTSEEDLDIVNHLNIVLDHIWDVESVPYVQMQAGDRAALLNTGITQVGWDNEIITGQDKTFTKGQVTFKNIDPMRFMRDPHAIDLDSSGYCIAWDRFHKNTILNNDLYKKEFSAYLSSSMNKHANLSFDYMSKHTDQPTQPSQDRYEIIIHWIRTKDGIDEVHTVNNQYILMHKPNIKPAIYPFAVLHCNLPADDVLGTSEPSKIFANSVAYNLMHSIALTAEAKNQKPPRYINANSGINMRDFVKHGADSDYVFMVNGDARQAVHYHQFPAVSQVTQSIAQTLGFDIGSVSGVNDKYTGASTGSILTTGGIEQMLDQATQIDQPKINNYEMYTKRLTQLVLGNLKQYGQTRNYFIKNPKTRQWETFTVNYDLLKDETIYNYAINVTPMLPKNKFRIAQTANLIMEKQMQYQQMGKNVELITPEEWLMMQDLPHKELMLKRMGIQRHDDYVEQVAKTVFQYASLLEAGVSPEDAIAETANAIENDTPSPLGIDEMGEQLPPSAQLENALT